MSDPAEPVEPTPTTVTIDWGDGQVVNGYAVSGSDGGTEIFDTAGAALQRIADLIGQTKQEPAGGVGQLLLRWKSETSEMPLVPDFGDLGRGAGVGPIVGQSPSPE